MNFWEAWLALDQGKTVKNEERYYRRVHFTQTYGDMVLFTTSHVESKVLSDSPDKKWRRVRMIPLAHIESTKWEIVD